MKIYKTHFDSWLNMFLEYAPREHKLIINAKLNYPRWLKNNQPQLYKEAFAEFVEKGSWSVINDNQQKDMYDRFGVNIRAEIGSDEWVQLMTWNGGTKFLNKWRILNAEGREKYIAKLKENEKLSWIKFKENRH